MPFAIAFSFRSVPPFGIYRGKGKRLMNHVIHNDGVMDQEFCGALCFMEHNCVSYNYIRTGQMEKQNCELNNATYEGHEEDLEENLDYVHRGAKVKTNQIM